MYFLHRSVLPERDAGVWSPWTAEDVNFRAIFNPSPAWVLRLWFSYINGFTESTLILRSMAMTALWRGVLPREGYSSLCTPPYFSRITSQNIPPEKGREGPFKWVTRPAKAPDLNAFEVTGQSRNKIDKLSAYRGRSSEGCKRGAGGAHGYWGSWCHWLMVHSYNVLRNLTYSIHLIVI